MRYWGCLGWLAMILAIALTATAILVLGRVIIAENDWSARCQAAGGHNVRHFEGISLIPTGKTLIPVSRYSNHCMVEGREVQV